MDNSNTARDSRPLHLFTRFAVLGAVFFLLLAYFLFQVEPLLVTVRTARWLVGLAVMAGLGLFLVLTFLGLGRTVRLIDSQNRDLQKQQEIQKLLKELSQDAASLDLDSLLKKLTEKIREFFRVDISDVWIVEGGVGYALGVSGAEIGSGRSLPIGSRGGRIKWMIENRRALVVTDLTDGTEFPTVKEACYPGVRGHLGVPLLSKSGEVIGVLRALTYQPRRYTEEEAELLQLLANDAATAVENSRLVQELTAKSQELESTNRKLNRLVQEQSALRQIFTQINLLDLGPLLDQLTEQALKLLNADHVQLRLFEEGSFRRLAAAGKWAERVQDRILGTGRSTWVMENQRPLAVKDISQDKTYGPGHFLREIGIKGYLLVPLISRGQKSIGVLAAASFSAREFTQEEITLGQQFAAGASIAIENARLFEEVQKKSQELEEAYRTKSAFLNTMAHELRTPLNVLIATMQLFTDGFYGELSAQQLKGLEPMQRNAVNLLNLISSILDLARLEAKRVPLDIEEFPLADITEELESFFTPLAKDKGVTLRFDIEEPALKLRSDKVKIKAILQNLLGNAVKYTDRGEIEFRISARPDSPGGGAGTGTISITVKDTGIGIKETDLPHIFEAFYMSEGVNRRKYPGSGLGLCIVSRLLDLLHGAIEVRSEWGRGSTFSATLPQLLPPRL